MCRGGREGKMREGEGPDCVEVTRRKKEGKMREGEGPGFVEGKRRKKIREDERG